VRAAIERAEQHFTGSRDDSISFELDSQVRLFHRLLTEMENELHSGTAAMRNDGMAHAIADCWPFESELGQLIIEAEYAFQRAVKKSDRQGDGPH
jgi:hypothetical protein